MAYWLGGTRRIQPAYAMLCVELFRCAARYSDAPSLRESGRQLCAWDYGLHCLVQLIPWRLVPKPFQLVCSSKYEIKTSQPHKFCRLSFVLVKNYTVQCLTGSGLALKCTSNDELDQPFCLCHVCRVKLRPIRKPTAKYE